MLPHAAILGSIPSTRPHNRRVVHLGTQIEKKKQHSTEVLWSTSEIYLRELNVASGGLGCAVWDGAIILTRWLLQHSDLFQDKYCMELGSGVGLPGILLGRYAHTCILSDYMDELISNLTYNITLNSHNDDDDLPRGHLSREEYQNIMEQRKIWRENLHKSTRAVLLDWDEMREQEQKQSHTDISTEPCTSTESSTPASTSTETSTSTSHLPYDPTNMGSHWCDYIIGAELIYTENHDHADALVHVLTTYLKHGGSYICVQSRNREGMSYFVSQMELQGFDVTVTLLDPNNPEHAAWLGNYHVGNSSKQVFAQREETYSLYHMKWTGHKRECPVTVIPKISMALDANAVKQVTQVTSLDELDRLSLKS